MRAVIRLVLVVFMVMIPLHTISDAGYIPHPIVSLKEEICMAYNIMFEATSQPLEGQIAVGWVVLNRVNIARFPDSVCKVVESPYQFSWLLQPVKRGWFQHLYIPSTYVGAWESAFNAARMVLSHSVEDPTRGALFYHTKQVNPSWSGKMERTAVIGDHVFFRPISD